MVIDVFKENKNNINDSKISFNPDESGSSEIARIKKHLDISCLKYVSSNIQYLLGINVLNDSTCFEKSATVFRVIQEGDTYRVILYVRLSVEDGDIIDGDVSRSIRNQLLILLDECEKRKWRVVGIFCEEGTSGADDNRPEWLKSLKFSENGHTEIVLCKSQSRFTRSMEMIEKYLHKEFVDWNVRFVGLVDSTDTSIVGNKKARQINGLVNEWMVEDQSINIRAVLKAKKENGLFIGAFAPYGYKKDPNDKYHLIIDEEAAKVIREIFSMYAKGHGAVKICQYLNNKHIPVPSIYKAQNGSKYHNSLIELNKKVKYQVEENDTLVLLADKYQSTVKDILKYNSLESENIEVGQVIVIPMRVVWRTTTVYNILKDELYIGTLVQHKNEIISYKNKKERKVPKDERIAIPHCHAAIIDSETWNIVSTRFETRGRAKPNKNGDIAVFSKKIICDCCGHKFYRNKCSVKAGSIYYWQCGNRYSTALCLCSNSKVLKEDEIYELVLQKINQEIKKYYDKSKVQKNYYEQKISTSLEDEIKILKKELKDLEIRVEKKNDAIALLYDDRASGVIDVTEFSIIKCRYVNEIESNNFRIQEINKELHNLDNKKSKKMDTEKILKKYEKLESLDRHTLDEFILNIYVGAYNKESGKRKIRIEWNIDAE